MFTHCQQRVVAAFTLIELLIIVAMLGILAAIVIPYYGESTDVARTEALATNLSHIRSQIVRYSSDSATVQSAGGYPAAIAGSWFRSGQLPDHAWSDRAMVVQTVNGPANHYLPATKTFDPMVVGAASVWYNNLNGAFCALVPAQATDGDTLALFNAVNKTQATALGQTSQ